MRSLALLLASSLLMPPALPASEFDWLVREFSRESGAKAMHIPFLGLARFVVAAGHPAGTSELRLAVFEHANLESVRFSQLTDEMVGSAWKLIVRAVPQRRIHQYLFAFGGRTSPRPSNHP
jgi:hypothetical protein